MISQMIQIGRLQVATPASMAMAVRNPTAAQTAVDERIAPVAAEIIGSDPTIISAAADAAAERALSDAGLVRGLNAASTDAVGGIVDLQGLLTWLTHDGTGGPSTYARGRLGLPVIPNPSGDIVGGFLDALNAATWLTHDASGGPSVYAQGRIESVMLDLLTGSNHTMLENEVRIRNGGTFRTAGKAPVCLIFDHGTVKFRDIILPLLTARGIPSVLALDSRMYDPAHKNYAENNGTTWAQIESWTAPSAYQVEIANHGATHDAAYDLAQLRDVIVTGLTELQSHLTRPVLSWVQPGDFYPGFNYGDSTAAYNTQAGRLILAHHACVTGVMNAPDGTVLHPRDGHFRPGVGGFWMDCANPLAGVQAQVNAAITQKKGILLRQHPGRVDTAGSLSTAELTSVLDWLVTQRDAGKIVLTNLQQWNIADTGA